MSDEAGAQHYHFDPATCLAMVLAEVPAYQDLQHRVAETARGIDAGSILELGVGTGETSSVVLAVHPGRAAAPTKPALWLCRWTKACQGHSEQADRRLHRDLRHS